MKARSFLLIPLLATLLAAPLPGQGSISNVFAPLATDFQACGPFTPPMYAPALYPYPDGSLGMITMGNCMGRCDVGMGDSLFRWKREPGGSWSSTFGGLTPSKFNQTLGGQTIPAGGLSQFKETINQAPPSTDPCGVTTQYTTYTGGLGYPATIVLNTKVYMAYEKGNSDWWNGEVWWAVSSDWGLTWSVYPSPIFYGRYHRGHAAFGGCPEGFAGISMTTSTDAGGTWINVYGSYFHPNREKRPQDAGTSAIHYRFRYDPNHPFGFSSTKELYYNGGFINHTGQFVWGYDAGAPAGADPKLDPNLTAAPWSPPGYFFTYSVTKDANGFYYMIVDHWRSAGEPLYYVTSCDAIHWSGVKTIDTTAVSSVYPNKILVNNALWYGTLSGQTAMWGFLSLGQFCSGDVYDGSRILPVKVTFSAAPTCN